jgi:hypothetical protein
VAVGVAVSAAVSVAGCGARSTSAPPTPLPLTSQTSNSTGTATSSVDPGSDGAILAAARAYLDTQAASVRSAETGPFFSISTPDCNCRIGVDSVVKYLKAHKYHEDITYSFVQPPLIQTRNETTADIRIRFSSNPYHVFDSAGIIVAEGINDRGDFVVSFRREGSRWVAFLSHNY